MADEIKKETEEKVTPKYMPGCAYPHRACCGSHAQCYQNVQYFPQTGRTLINGCCRE